MYDPRGNHLAPPNTSDTSQPPASPVSGKDPTTNSVRNGLSFSFIVMALVI